MQGIGQFPIPILPKITQQFGSPFSHKLVAYCAKKGRQHNFRQVFDCCSPSLHRRPISCASISSGSLRRCGAVIGFIWAALNCVRESRPLRSMLRAASRQLLASPNETSGNRPKVSVCALSRWSRYFMRHVLAPLVIKPRYRPPSASRVSLTFGQMIK